MLFWVRYLILTLWSLDLQQDELKKICICRFKEDLDWTHPTSGSGLVRLTSSSVYVCTPVWKILDSYRFYCHTASSTGLITFMNLSIIYCHVHYFRIHWCSFYRSLMWEFPTFHIIIRLGFTYVWTVIIKHCVLYYFSLKNYIACISI